MVSLFSNGWQYQQLKNLRIRYEQEKMQAEAAQATLSRLAERTDALVEQSRKQIKEQRSEFERQTKHMVNNAPRPTAFCHPGCIVSADWLREYARAAGMQPPAAYGGGEANLPAGAGTGTPPDDRGGARPRRWERPARPRM